MLRIFHPHYGEIVVPHQLDTLDGFRAWVSSDDLPEKLKVHYLGGDILIDFEPEDVNSHNQVKAEIHFVLSGLVESTDFGVYIPNGFRFTNEAAGWSCLPDAVIISHSALE